MIHLQENADGALHARDPRTLPAGLHGTGVPDERRACAALDCTKALIRCRPRPGLDGFLHERIDIFKHFFIHGHVIKFPCIVLQLVLKKTLSVFEQQRTVVAKRLAIFPRATHSNALGRVRAQGACQSSHTRFDAEVSSPDFIYAAYTHKK